YERSIIGLLRLRAICRHWNSIIGLICETQRSLILVVYGCAVLQRSLSNYENLYKFYMKHFPDQDTEDAILYLGKRRYFSKSVDQADRENLLLPLELAHFLVRQFPNLQGLVTSFYGKQGFIHL